MVFSHGKENIRLKEKIRLVEEEKKIENGLTWFTELDI